MELHNLDQILAMAKGFETKQIGAAKDAVIDAVLEAVDDDLVTPILVGETAKIQEMLVARGRKADEFEIVETYEGQTPADTAVELIKEGRAGFLMKGSVETSELLRPVVKRDNGLRTGRTISHVAIYQLPFHDKLLVTTDCGITAYPDTNKKKEIIQNAVEALHLLGYEEPKVAVLCCKETPDNGLPETIEARELQEMAERGEMGKCKVVGPISYDLAMSKDRAKLKKYDCPYCGEFDILVVPNILGKCLELLPGAEMCSYVSGARIPIVLTSRAAPAKERLTCMALAGIIAANRAKQEA